MQTTAPISHLAPSRRFVFLDGLRGIAAIAVVILHVSDGLSLPNLVPHAGLAVDFFFLLSGFVIAFAYEDRLRDGGMSFAQFSMARLIRLYPMLLLGLLFGSAVFLLRIITRSEHDLIAPFLGAFALGLLMLPSHLIGGPGYSTAYPFNVPSWSLFFEIVANAVYAGLARRLSNLRLALITLAGAVGLFISTFQYDGVAGGSDWATFLLGSWRVLFAFSAGILLYRLRSRLPSGPPILGFALSLGLAALLVLPLEHSWVYDSICVFVLFPFIIAAGAGVRLGKAASGACMFVGRLSYPLYVLHYPAVRFIGSVARTRHFSGVKLELLGLATVAAVLMLATITMVVIDEPLRRWLTAQVNARPGTAKPLTAPSSS